MNDQGLIAAFAVSIPIAAIVAIGDWTSFETLVIASTGYLCAAAIVTFLSK